MPSRSEPFVNNEIYHVFNKTIDDRVVFNDINYCSRFLDIACYYRSSEIKFSYSRVSSLNPAIEKSYLKKIYHPESFRVQILAYCLMPTHYHFLIKQKKENGISRYISDLMNSFTRYLNITLIRKGPIFLSDFKSVRINNETQFMHVSRYIHLNPYSSRIVQSYNGLINYPWSSLRSYMYSPNDNLVSQQDLLSLFHFDKNRYRSFVLSNAEHQKTLKVIRYTKKW